MRRADRLFRLIQALRREKLTTAARLAGEMGVSERTIYRDIRDLAASGVPVAGEAGVGYMLRDDDDLPPLMFDIEEIDALVLGARVVEAWTDPDMARAARTALAKIEAAMPRTQRHWVHASPISVGERVAEPLSFDPAALREAVRARRKLDIAYRDVAGQATERRVWPLGLLFYGPVWLLAAWCELRTDYRVFRLDRIGALSVSQVCFRPGPGRSLQDFLARQSD